PLTRAVGPTSSAKAESNAGSKIVIRPPEYPRTFGVIISIILQLGKRLIGINRHLRQNCSDPDRGLASDNSHLPIPDRRPDRRRAECRPSVLFTATLRTAELRRALSAFV